MANNMTRKGLAVGAAFALAISGLVSLPAQAAAGIDLAAKDGKSVYGMVSGETFTLTANGNVDFNVNNAGLLRVEVENVTGGGSPAGFAINGEALVSDKGETTTNSILLADGTNGTASTLGTTAGNKAVMGLGAVTGAGANYGASVMTSPFTFSFSATAAAETPQVFAVTVFADTNNNGVRDAGELASATRLVTFVNPADVSVNYVIDDLTEGDLAVGADVTLPGIAIDQLTAAKFGVLFTTGTGAALGTQTAKLDIVSFDTNKTKFRADLALTLTGGLVKDTAVRAQLRFLSAGPDVEGTNGANVGGFATKVVVARTVTSITAAAVASTTAKVVDATNADSLLNSTFQVKASTLDADGNGLAGKSVQVKVTSAGLQATAPAKTLTVNGTTYSAPGALPGQGTVSPITVTTNAAGDAVVTLTTTGYSAGNAAIEVEFTVENLTPVTLIIGQRAAVYTLNIVNAGAFTSTVVGSPVTAQVRVYDQFGGLPANEFDLRATLVDDGTTEATTGLFSATPLVGGAANVVLSNNAAKAGELEFRIDMQKRLPGGAYDQSVANATHKTVITTADKLVAATVSSVAVSAGGGKLETAVDSSKAPAYVVTGSARALNLQDVKNFDKRAVLGDAPTLTAANAVQLAGVVSTASSATVAASAIAGAAVTISGAGLQFDNAAQSAAGSITVFADENGRWSVDVYSNRAGKQTVTVTSGSASATVEVTFAAAADNSGANVSVVVTNAVAGSTMRVVTTITDKFGNPVDSNQATQTPLSIVYDGPGFIVSGETPDETGADGTATFHVFLGANDVVTGSVTVTYAGTSRLLATTTDNITAVANFGGTVAAEGARGWTRFLSATNELKIYARDVVGAGKVQFMVNGRELAWIRAVDATDPKLNVMNDGMVRSVFVRDMLVGRNVIEIYVDGVRLDRRIFTR